MRCKFTFIHKAHLGCLGLVNKWPGGGLAYQERSSLEAVAELCCGPGGPRPQLPELPIFFKKLFCIYLIFNVKLIIIHV